MLAYKDLDKGYMEEWKKRHHEASTVMDGREERLDELYEEIEKDMLVSAYLEKNLIFCTILYLAPDVNNAGSH